MKTTFTAASISFFLAAGALQAQETNFTVSSAAELQAALAQAFTNNVANPALANTITVTGNISATAQMVVNANVSIHGGGYTINMSNSDRAFFIAGGNVAISNLAIQNGNATGGAGGNGGGGGGGLGGAIFVGSGTFATWNGSAGATGISAPVVTLSGVRFQNNQAVGGSAPIVQAPGEVAPGGGGGGMGGSGGSTAGFPLGQGAGGGGFGNGAIGGYITIVNYNSTLISAGNGSLANVGGANTSGGWGGPGFEGSGFPGGINGGGGGSGQSSGNSGAGGGGGIGGESGYYQDDTAPNGGGSGGFGGGGGGSTLNSGGTGGFGGGGGAGRSTGNGGPGGFGGGGGGISVGSGTGGAGGFGAGHGANEEGPGGGGGGGLGAGGAVFVMAGAALTVIDGEFSGSSVAAGTGYYSGSAYGTDLFLGADVAFNVSSNLTLNSLGGAGNFTDPNVANHANDPNAQGGIIKTGAGNLMLAGTNYYAGPTTVNAGTLALLAGALAQGTSNVVVGQNPGDSATLVLGSNSTLTLGGFNGTSGTDSPVVIAQNAGSTGTVVIGAVAGSSGADIGARIFTGGNGSARLVFAQNFAAGSGDNTDYPFYTTLTGNLDVFQNGNGTTLLQPLYGNNTFNGAVTVASGTLRLANTSALAPTNWLTANGGVFDIFGGNFNLLAATLNGGTIADSAGGGSLTVSSLAGNGSVGLQSALLVAEVFGNENFSGSLSGNGSLTKSGPGTLKLTGNNNYSGATTVAAGTLLVDGSIGTSSEVGVAAGATLGGNGTIGGNLTLQGKLSPGASTGSLSVGRIVFDAASVFDYEADSYAPASSAGDLLVVAGNVDIAAGAAIEFSDLSQSPAPFAEGTILSLVSYGGEWNGGFFSLNGTSLGQGNHFTAGGTVWSIDYAATSGGLNFQTDQIDGKFINITAVPEPSVVALLGLGALAWSGLARCAKRRVP